MRVAALIVGALVVVAPCHGFSQALPTAVQVPESFARKSATHVVMPAYPTDAVAKSIEGVSVSVARIGRDGKVIHVHSLESPSDSIAKAVETAVKDWIFEPVQVRSGNGRQTVIGDAKLTFYFRLEDGKAVVVNPDLAMPASGSPGQLIELRQPGLDKLLTSATPAVLIDIRDRAEYLLGHRPNAVNIPADELPARTREFAAASAVILDCLDPVEELCPLVATALAARLQKDVYLLRPQ